MKYQRGAGSSRRPLEPVQVGSFIDAMSGGETTTTGSASMRTSMLRARLQADTNERYALALGHRLQALAVQAHEQARASTTCAELRRRSAHLAHGADVAARLLPRLASALQQRCAQGDAPSSASTLPSVSDVVLELGWLALEEGFEREACALLHAMGVVLHGTFGGVLYEAQGLMSKGCLPEAAQRLEYALDQHEDVDGMASTLLALLWRAMDDARWVLRAQHVLASCSNAAARALCDAQLRSAA
jgi:hypothetical protein